jgi:hypothetical protein
MRKGRSDALARTPSTGCPQLNRALRRSKRVAAGAGAYPDNELPMIRFVFRFIGLWILAAGFVALVRDGTKSIAGNAIFVTSLTDDWTNIHNSSLDALRSLVERYGGAPAWEVMSLYLLARPTWLVLGIIGSIFILIGRKKKPLIGYGRD